MGLVYLAVYGLFNLLVMGIGQESQVSDSPTRRSLVDDSVRNGSVLSDRNMVPARILRFMHTRSESSWKHSSVMSLRPWLGGGEYEIVCGGPG